jgi:hypothetical protein
VERDQRESLRVRLPRGQLLARRHAARRAAARSGRRCQEDQRRQETTLKICLATQHADAAFTPLALLYLKAYVVERLGLRADDVAILEFPADTTSGEIAAAVLAPAPDVVGLSCYVWNVRTLAAACREIKARRPGARVVLGGPEVGPVASRVLEAHRAVDVVVRSEGERPFAELVKRWIAGAGIDGVEGVAFRRDDSVHETADAQILTDLNQLPSLWRKGREVDLDVDRDPPYHVRSHFSVTEDDVRYGWRVVRALQELGDSRTLRQLARDRGIGYADLVDAWISWDSCWSFASGCTSTPRPIATRHRGSSGVERSRLDGPREAHPIAAQDDDCLSSAPQTALIARSSCSVVNGFDSSGAPVSRICFCASDTAV